MYPQNLFPTLGLCQSLPLLALFAPDENHSYFLQSRKREMWKHIWYLKIFYGLLVTHFSASTFMKQFEMKVSKPSKPEKAARQVLCWLQHFTIWESAIKPNVLEQGGLFSLCFAVIKLHTAARSFKTVKSQIFHTQNKQIMFELIFFISSILSYKAVFNYFLLLWLYACF